MAGSVLRRFFWLRSINFPLTSSLEINVIIRNNNHKLCQLISTNNYNIYILIGRFISNPVRNNFTNLNQDKKILLNSKYIDTMHN